MRIDKIVLCNLASIEGEQTIDFGSEPLRSAGLFAITGDTGAGKSTLLDAICLAFYNHAPRFDDVERLARFDGRKPNSDVELQAGDTRNILRRGCREGYSEVTFTTSDGAVYRAEWHLRLKRTGTYNKVERRLEQLEPQHRRYDEAEVDARIRQLTGLDYTQFTRTVILAQNSFANFLRARQGEKSSLLEKLTGTEVYGRISRQVYRLNEEAAHACERCESVVEGLRVNRLDEADLETAHHEQRLRRTRLEETERQLAVVAARQKWCADYRKAMDELEQREREKTEARRAYSLLYGGEELLGRYDSVLSVQPLYRAIKMAEKDLGAISAYLRENSKKQADCRKMTAEAMAEAEKARAEREAAEQEVRETQPKLNRGRAVEGEMAVARAEWKRREEHRNRLHALLTEKERSRAEQQTALAAAERQAGELTKRKQALATHQRMFEQADRIGEKLLRLGELEDEVQQLRRRADEVRRNREEQAHTLEELEKKRGELQSALEGLRAERQTHRQAIYGLDSAELQERHTRLSNHRQLLQQAQSVWQRITDNRSLLLDKEAEITRRSRLLKQQTTAADQLQRTVEVLKATCERMGTAYTLSQSENIVSLRRRLKEGTACPVCGATHHPYHTETEQELGELLSNLEHDYREAAKELADKQREWQELEHGLALEKGRLAAEEHHVEQMRAQLAASQREWTAYAALDPSFADCSASVNSDARRLLIGQLLDSATKEADEAHKALDIFNRHQKVIDSLNERIDSRENSMADTANRLNELRTAQRVLASTLEEVQHHCARNEQLCGELYDELEKCVTIPAWHETWSRNRENFRNGIRRGAHDWLTTNEAIAENEQQQLRLRETVRTAEENIAENRRELQRADEEKRTTEELIAEKTDELRKLFDGKSPDDVEQALQQQLRRTRERETACEARKTACKNDAQALTGEMQTLQKQQTSRETELAARKTEMDLWISRYNNEHPTLQFAELERLFNDTRDWNALRAAVARAREAATLADSRMEMAQQRVVTLQASPDRPSERDGDTYESLKAAQQELEARRTEAQEALTQVNLRLMAHERSERQERELAPELESLRRKKEQWAGLCALIGSADGKRFREQAQAYTFRFLVEQANAQLKSLSPRYRLRHIPNTLGLEIIDRDMFDQKRPISSLSGGETFIVSLALALSLSSLSSGNLAIGSLFIDEGFGNLDNESLELVMDALGNLQAEQGRKVGVISHTEQIRSRIAPQIHLIKEATGGRSRIKIE